MTTPSAANTPPATIVIPLLRQLDGWLRRAVLSALAQTVPAEVVVITSPHTPRSNLAVLAEVARHTDRRLIVAPRTRVGFANAINTGFELARSERVGLLLSDDWLTPDALAECLPIDADIVSTGAMRYDERGTSLPHLTRALRAEDYLARETLEQKASYLTHLLVFRRNPVLAAGGLDETIGDAPGVDDYDLIWTLLERGATVGLTSRPLYNFTVHAGERLTMRAAAEQLQTLGRIFDKHGFTGPAREQRLREHGRWFGRPEDAVLAEIRASQVAPETASS